MAPSTTTQQTSSRRFAVTDLAALICAAVLLVIFFFLPWINLGEDGTLSGAQLVTEAPPPPNQFLNSGIFLIAAAGIVGVLAGLWTLWLPRHRRAAAGWVFVGGIIGVVYYILFVINNARNLSRTFEVLGIGFWLAGLAVAGLLILPFWPKARRPDIVDHSGLYFLLPGVVWVLGFTIFPLIYSLGLSFTNQRLGREAEFIGLENYITIFGDQRAQETILTSVFLSIGGVALTVLFGTFIAWLFNRDLPGLRVFRTIMTTPLFAAPVALGFLGKVLFNENSGPINYLLLGLGGEAVPWFTHPLWARIAVLIVDVWQWTPFVFIVVLAAMQSISDEIYEAARLDTSSGWDLFRNITFPLIAPALGTVAILRLVETFKILDIPLSMTGGGPGTATETYSYHAYNEGLGLSFNLGYASALAYLLVIIAIIVTTIYFLRVRDRFEVER